MKKKKILQCAFIVYLYVKFSLLYFCFNVEHNELKKCMAFKLNRVQLKEI